MPFSIKAPDSASLISIITYQASLANVKTADL